MKKITKSEAFELLKNKKIFVGNSTISELVQDRLFKAGYKWCVDGAKIVNTIHNFLYTNSYKITFDDSIDFYNKSEKKEISAMEILSWEIVEDNPTFKPFDKVLVKDEEHNEYDEWRIGLYSHFSTIRNRHIVNTIPWRFCIPYEGNEDLVGTTNDAPKEGEQ